MGIDSDEIAVSDYGRGGLCPGPVRAPGVEEVVRSAGPAGPKKERRLPRPSLQVEPISSNHAFTTSMELSRFLDGGCREMITEP